MDELQRTRTAIPEPRATTSGVDGRVLRGARTKGRIVQALLDLVTDGVANPTAAAIAERAGVSVRSVFQHFDDLESLYADLAAEQSVRVAPLLESLERPESLDERIDALVAQRRELFEVISPVRHAIGGRASESPALRRRLDEIATALRRQVAQQFDTELAALDPTVASTLLDVVDTVSSFEVWDRFRTVQRLAPSDAADAMATALRRLLH
jgi:AcrR family transcriptional regulator